MKTVEVKANFLTVLYLECIACFIYGTMTGFSIICKAFLATCICLNT